MDIKNIAPYIIGFLGWAWAIVQFFVNRRNQLKDKLIDRKYDAYVTYMKKYEEIVNNYRKNSTSELVYGMPTSLLNEMLTGDEIAINNALLAFNSKLVEVVKSACEPMLIIKQELNALRLICSPQLVTMIKELDLLILKFNEQTRHVLEAISSMDMNRLNQMNVDFTQSDEWLRFEELNNEIIDLMRKEIGAK